MRGLEFFDQFTDHAAKSNAQKRQVLDEILLHEDDPLYWVNDITTPGPDTPETGTKPLQSSHSHVPPIPEEPSPPAPQGRGGVSSRCVNEFSKPNAT